MPRLVSGPARYRFGGVIEGKDYTNVVKVLEDIAEAIGLTDESNLPVVDLPQAFVDYLERDRDISYNLGYEEGKTAMEGASPEDVEAACLLARTEGYSAGLEAGLASPLVQGRVDQAREEGYAAGLTVVQEGPDDLRPVGIENVLNEMIADGDLAIVEAPPVKVPPRRNRASADV